MRSEGGGEEVRRVVNGFVVELVVGLEVYYSCDDEVFEAGGRGRVPRGFH